MLAGFAVTGAWSRRQSLTDLASPSTRDLALVERSTRVRLAGDQGGRVLVSRGREGRAFHAEEIQRLQDFANQAAIALENARLFALETSRREQLEALASVQRDLSAELDLDRLITLIVERAGRLVDGFGFAYLVDEESQSLDGRVWSRAEPESGPRPRPRRDRRDLRGGPPGLSSTSIRRRAMRFRRSFAWASGTRWRSS
jgi:hypothetical protein